MRAWRKNVFYGWWIVATGFVMSAVGGGSHYFGFSVYFEAMVRHFGWSRAATAGAFSLASLEGGFEGLILGPMVDRYGARRWMIAGFVMLGLGLILLSQTQSIVMFYVAYGILMAIGANTAVGMAPTAVVANWFNRRQTLAFGILSAGFSVGGAVIAPAIAWMIANFGWQTAAAINGVFLWCVGIPLAILVIRNRPQDMGMLPDGDLPARSAAAVSPGNAAAGSESAHAEDDPAATGFTLREAMRTQAFWFLAAAFALRNFTLNAIIAHQVALLVDRGFDSQSAANVLGFTATVGIPARLLFGFLGDVFPKRTLLAGAFALQAVSFFLLLTAQGPVQVYLFAALLGMAWGSVPVFFSLRTEYFGRRSFATIGGVMQSVTTLGNFSGPIFAGLVYDYTRSYEVAIGLFIVFCLGSVAMILMAKRPQHHSYVATMTR